MPADGVSGLLGNIKDVIGLNIAVTHKGYVEDAYAMDTALRAGQSRLGPTNIGGDQVTCPMLT